ncbi:hypothetical protein HX882_02745 [Pseudomonas gingeri]|uniref:DUF3742 family protein n=1 Tax=Pseudomonas gingeri TaxID=117681 RepID=A0A7Y7X882_9PSED|nr:hypothetical protein [Pseudomonas gingeri]NWB94806.1 hypothetical protein [Pseudomonas gingeri]
MTAHTSQGFANRLGYGLGRVVLFFLVDENLVLRWVKRGVLAVLGYVFFAHFGRGVMSVLMTPLILLFAVLAVARFGGVVRSGSGKVLGWSHHPSVPRDGPAGYGYYDGHGNFRGSSNPYDDQ